jgi:hypothetical protein
MSSEFEDFVRSNYEKDDYLAVNRLVRGAGPEPEQGRVAMRQQVLPAEEVVSDKYQRFLRGQNATGADVYVGVNAFKPEAHGRGKDDVAAVRHVYLDIDHDGKAVVDKILQSEMRPHHIFESSPGRFQALWSVEGLSVQEAEAATRGMVREFGGDPAVWDAARILRAPGFRNWKPEYAAAKPWVKEVDTPKAVVKAYGIEDLEKFVEVGKDHFERGTAEKGAARDREGGRDQSARDWRYAMTHLERGEDPEKIKEAIAAYRSDPAHGYKHNPRAYAELTVEKAERAKGMER